MKNLPYRNHISHTKMQLDGLRHLRYDVNDTFSKPKGLWYGIKDNWYKYLATELGNLRPSRKYIYDLRLKRNSLVDIDSGPDPDKILQIKTFPDYMTFKRKYVVIKECGRKGQNFSWSKLKQDYAGVEIRNVKRMINEVGGLFGADRTLGSWDVDSGCIWDVNVIRAIELVGKKQF